MTSHNTNEDTLIYNDVYISPDVLSELITASSLERCEVIKRLRQIYTQTNKSIEEIIEEFKNHDYNVLKTLKSFYLPQIKEAQKPTIKSTKSINQQRMTEIRKYMNERETIKTQQQRHAKMDVMSKTTSQ